MKSPTPKTPILACTRFAVWRGYAGGESAIEPTLTIEAGRGLRRIVINYDEDDQEAGFDLLCQALPALQRLDLTLRRERAPAPAQGGRGGPVR